MRLFLLGLCFLAYNTNLAASACPDLFAETEIKRFIFAVAKTYHNEFLESLAHTPEVISLDLSAGISPKQWETALYKLSSSIDKPSLKPSFKTKDWLKNRLNILLSVRQLNTMSEDLSLARKNSSLEVFKHHWHLISFPNFFAPSFLFSNYFYFNKEILDNFEKNGFEHTYENFILPQYPNLSRADAISRNLPSITSLALVGSIVGGTIVEFWPQPAYEFSYDPNTLNGLHFQLWQEARLADRLSADLKNHDARKDWSIFLYENYEGLFKPEFERRYGREPDLKISADLNSWHEFTYNYITWFDKEAK